MRATPVTEGDQPEPMKVEATYDQENLARQVMVNSVGNIVFRNPFEY